MLILQFVLDLNWLTARQDRCSEWMNQALLRRNELSTHIFDFNVAALNRTS